MAFIINLHGPNTNNLGKMVANTLNDLGYDAIAVQSVRRDVELRAPDTLDGSLEVCDAIATRQAEVNRQAIEHAKETGQDVVLICGPIVDSYKGYQGDRGDSGYREAVAAAVEADAAGLELMPRSGLRESVVTDYRNFLRDARVAPRIEGSIEFGHQDIVNIACDELAQERKTHPMKRDMDKRVDFDRSKLVSSFKRTAVGVHQAIEELPEDSPMRKQLERMVEHALEDGYGGVRMDTVRMPNNGMQQLDELLEPIKAGRASLGRDDFRSSNVVDEDQDNDRAAERAAEEPEADNRSAEKMPQDTAKDLASKEKPANERNLKVDNKSVSDTEDKMTDNAKDRNNKVSGKSGFVNIEFASADVRFKSFTDRSGTDRLRMTMTMPQGTEVAGKDLSGWKVSMLAQPFMKRDKEAGKPVRYGFKSDRGVEFFKYDRNNQRIEYPAAGDAPVMPEALKGAVEAAYESRSVSTDKQPAEVMDQGKDSAERKFCGITFARCDIHVKDFTSRSGEEKHSLICRIPQHTIVGGKDLGGHLISKVLSDKQMAHANSDKPFTVSFQAGGDVSVYPPSTFENATPFDYNYRKGEQIPTEALIAAVEDAYDMRLGDARNYEAQQEAKGQELSGNVLRVKEMLEERDVAAVRSGSKDVAQEFNENGGSSTDLDELCEAKGDEAESFDASRDSLMSIEGIDLYDKDVEF